MRLLICAGGTGGGVYPALSAIQASGSDPSDLLWVGSEHGMDADLVNQTEVSGGKIPFTTIPAAGVHGVGLRAMPRNLLQLGRGGLAARRLLSEFRPDVMLFTEIATALGADRPEQFG